MRHAALLLTPVLLLLLAAVPRAQAAEGFLGVLTDGRAVRFTDQAPTALTTPRAVRGLAPGERIVALAPGLALGRSGALYRLAAGRLGATPTGVRLALEGRSFSLVRTAGGARILSDAGQDLLVGFDGGTVTPGPGLRLASGQAARPSVALRGDGRLTGVEARRSTLVTETAPGSNVMTETPLRDPRGSTPGVARPVAFAVAGGAGYLLSGFPERTPRPQSRFLRVDMVTGATRGDAGPYFQRQLAAVLPLGPVAADRTPPRVALRVPARVSVRALRREGGVRVTVGCSEGCFAFGATAVGGRPNLAASASRDTAGAVILRLPRLGRQELRLLRRGAARANFRVTVEDWSGNRRTVVRPFRLVP